MRLRPEPRRAEWSPSDLFGCFAAEVDERPLHIPFLFGNIEGQHLGGTQARLWPVRTGKASLKAAVPWQEMHRPFPRNCDGRRSQGDHPSTYADVHADQRTFRAQESQLSAGAALLRYGTL